VGRRESEDDTTRGIYCHRCLTYCVCARACSPSPVGAVASHVPEPSPVLVSKSWESSLKGVTKPLSPMTTRRLANARGMSVPEFISNAPSLGIAPDLVSTARVTSTTPSVAGTPAPSSFDGLVSRSPLGPLAGAPSPPTAGPAGPARPVVAKAASFVARASPLSRSSGPSPPVHRATQSPVTMVARTPVVVTASGDAGSSPTSPPVAPSPGSNQAGSPEPGAISHGDADDGTGDGTASGTGTGAAAGAGGMVPVPPLQMSAVSASDPRPAVVTSVSFRVSAPSRPAGPAGGSRPAMLSRGRTVSSRAVVGGAATARAGTAAAASPISSPPASGSLSARASAQAPSARVAASPRSTGGASPANAITAASLALPSRPPVSGKRSPRAARFDPRQPPIVHVPSTGLGTPTFEVSAAALDKLAPLDVRDLVVNELFPVKVFQNMFNGSLEVFDAKLGVAYPFVDVCPLAAITAEYLRVLLSRARAVRFGHENFVMFVETVVWVMKKCELGASRCLR
jgi:hypothetical protein